MAEVRNPTEPSMEEILASIRRIIVEDNGRQPASVAEPRGSAAANRIAGTEPASRGIPMPPNAASPQMPRTPPVQEAILDLTERVDDEDLVHRAAETLPPAATPPLPQNSAGRLNRPPPFKAAGAELREPRPVTETASLATSVATLTKLATIGQSARQTELPLGDVGRTLEDMVRELLRPHMKEWLDANLPRLVERMVRDEIARLVREAQER
jgi:uncharacterized protein